MFSLEGKTVVVTGGGRGIGRGIVRAVARQGANVVITGRTVSSLEEAAGEARGYGVEALIAPGDITNMETIAQTVQAAVQRFGYIDCWVNNAGAADPRDVGPLFTIDHGKWDRVVNLNLKGAFFAAQAAARSMTRGGSIINISSRSGSQPCPNTGQYGAAKAALESLTWTMAVEWGHLNIRVNAISPGVVLVERHAQQGQSMSTDSRMKRQLETVPLRRLGNVDDIGPLAVYFASDESAWVSGQVVQVTGGSRLPVGLLTYLWKINQEMDARESAATAE